MRGPATPFGSFLRSSRIPARRQRGVTLVETSLVLGLVGMLSVIAMGMAKPPRMDLTCVEQEIPATVMQAMHLARARGTNVSVALANPQKAPDILPLILPRQVKWGKPAHVPLPPGMSDPVKADSTGEAHAKITVTPRHTTTATTWFLNDGEDVLCMRLSGRGHLQLLRWRASRKAWGRV